MAVPTATAANSDAVSRAMDQPGFGMEGGDLLNGVYQQRDADADEQRKVDYLERTGNAPDALPLVRQQPGGGNQKTDEPAAHLSERVFLTHCAYLRGCVTIRNQVGFSLLSIRWTIAI